MKSVFNTDPPNFSVDEAKNIVYDYHNIKTDLNNLSGDRDQNFICNSGDKKYILKISNPAEKRSVLEMQNEVFQYIQKRDPSLKIPNQIGIIENIEKDGQKYFVRLLEYVTGKFLKDSKLNDKIHENLGKFMGRLSNALDGFLHPIANRPFYWDVRANSLVRSRLDYLENERQKKTVLHFLNEFAININAKELRLAVIHNDGNDHNILVNEFGETIGIIDFGDMVYSYQCAEIAVCMTYVGLAKEEPFEPMACVLKGYHARFPLQNEEIISAIYLSCVRLCISVTMSAWRMKLFPENEYLSISQESAWDVLKFFEKEDLKDWSEKLLEYVRS